MKKEQINLTKIQFENWLVALRSEKYEQYYGGALKSPEKTSFCCMGVLCETNGLKKFVGAGATHYFSENWSWKYADIYPDILAGGTRNPMINVDEFPKITKKYRIDEGGWMDLTRLNDRHRVGFKDLADMIESSFEVSTNIISDFVYVTNVTPNI